ncbi:MAG: hypothetical protein AAFY88_03845 [Acidobacteriota bacterium]
MGFSDLGGSAEPDLAFAGMVSTSTDGPTILKDDVGDSLFTDGAEPTAAEPKVEEPSYANYLGDDHFEHRPQPKKERPVLIISALILVLVGALAYLFGAGLFELGHAGPAPTSVPAEVEAVDSPDAVDPEASSEPAPAARSDPPPPARRADPAPTRPAQTPPAQDRPRAGGGALRSLESVDIRNAGSGIEIVATVTGSALGASDFEQFRLDGDNPRYVVKIFGVKRTERRPVAVGRGGVRQVRTGWHREEPGGRQVHLVIDLDGASAQITGVRADGRRLVIRAEP